MQIEKLTQIPNIASKNNFSIFELPKSCDFSELFPSSLHIRREDEKTVITKEQIDQSISLANNKQSSELNIVIEEAEIMNPAAANCILKNLEEPGEHIHYIFLVYQMSKIIPTIKSRAFCYYLKNHDKISDAPKASAEDIALAKSYIAANASELLSIAEKIAKDKKDSRKKALRLVDTAIELMYKSYFASARPQFLDKLNQLLKAHDALVANGNIKLQLIANML